jgi:CAAX protease family protein
MSKDSSKVITPAKSWNPWVGVVVGVAALFGSQLIVGVLLSIYPAVKHWNSSQADAWLTNSVAAQFIFVLLAEAIAIAAVYFFIKRYRGGLRQIGIRRPNFMDPVFGLLGLPAYFVIYFLLLDIVVFLVPGLNTNEKQQIGFNTAHGPEQLVLTFISLVVLPPIAEELIFRGLIYTSLKKVIPLWGAVIVTSLLFAAGHLTEGGSQGLLYIGAIDTFSLSLILIYLREKTDALWASMTLHALKNFIAFIALFALHLG